MIPNSYTATDSTRTSGWSDTTILTGEPRLKVWINGHLVCCPYDIATGTAYLPDGAWGPGTSVVIVYDPWGCSDSTASSTYGEQFRETDRIIKGFKKVLHSKPPWEVEDWSPRVTVGCLHKGVNQNPPKNRPMQRQRRPPSWARRKRA